MQRQNNGGLYDKTVLNKISGPGTDTVTK